ncbi:Uncharacterized protein dnm_080630 [Desulfonema magnum]|uniref:Uncharacterized protein n=1 Tax=Desulfonema magnum TaxID=45655 RepID=A0A975BVP6_9BACT|nr:Uncharacterized protein dnm_080630 [Desulfonema magnum]
MGSLPYFCYKKLCVLKNIHLMLNQKYHIKKEGYSFYLNET